MKSYDFQIQDIDLLCCLSSLLPSGFKKVKLSVPLCVMCALPGKAIPEMTYCVAGAEKACAPLYCSHMLCIAVLHCIIHFSSHYVLYDCFLFSQALYSVTLYVLQALVYQECSCLILILVLVFFCFMYYMHLTMNH